MSTPLCDIIDITKSSYNSTCDDGFITDKSRATPCRIPCDSKTDVSKYSVYSSNNSRVCKSGNFFGYTTNDSSGTTCVLQNGTKPTSFSYAFDRFSTDRFGNSTTPNISLNLKDANGITPVNEPPAFGTSNTLTTSDGTYTASASSVFVNAGIRSDAYKGFDQNDSTNWESVATYNVSTGVYTGTQSTVDINGNTYNGEWLQIRLPIDFVLTSFQIIGTAFSNFFSQQSPTTFKVYGSKTGTSGTWKELYNASGISWSSATVNSVGTFVVNNNTTPFSYFRIAISVIGNSTATINRTICAIRQWTLTGTKKNSLDNSNVNVTVTSSSYRNDSNDIPSNVMENDSSFWRVNSQLYNPYYIGTAATTYKDSNNDEYNSYLGEWIQFKFDYPNDMSREVFLNSISLRDTTFSKYAIFGGKENNTSGIEGIDWTILKEETSINTTMSVSSTINSQNSYKYYRIAVNQLNYTKELLTTETETLERYTKTDTTISTIQNPSLDFGTVPVYSDWWKDTGYLIEKEGLCTITCSTPVTSSMTNLNNPYNTVLSTLNSATFDENLFWQFAGKYTNASGQQPGSAMSPVFSTDPSLYAANTPVGSENVYGEWIQIKYPYAVSIKSFSIRAVNVSAFYSSPRSVFLAGSNDGNNWEKICSHTDIGVFSNGSVMTLEANMGDFSGGTNITTSVKNFGLYCYFRLIVTGVGYRNGTPDPGRSTPKISRIFFNVVNTYRLSTQNYSVRSSLNNFDSATNLLSNLFDSNTTNRYDSGSNFNSSTGLISLPDTKIKYPQTFDIGSYSYSGEWIDVVLPYQTYKKLTHFLIKGAGTDTDNLYKNSYPSDFMVLGSEDAVSWDLLCEYKGIKWINSTDKIFFTQYNQDREYRIFRLAVNKIGNSTETTGKTSLKLSVWALFYSELLEDIFTLKLNKIEFFRQVPIDCTWKLEDVGCIRTVGDPNRGKIKQVSVLENQAKYNGTCINPNPDPLYTKTCEIECVYSEWVNDGECEYGEQKQTRQVIDAGANNDGCRTTSQTIKCTPNTDCVLSDWGEWSSCENGKQARRKTIKTYPSGTGRACDPNVEEIRECKTSENYTWTLTYPTDNTNLLVYGDDKSNFVCRVKNTVSYPPDFTLEDVPSTQITPVLTESSLTINGQLYVFKSSSTDNNQSPPWYNPWAGFSLSENGWRSGLIYTSTGDYPGKVKTKYTTSFSTTPTEYLGEWIQIQLPKSIVLKNFSIRSNARGRTPKDFIVLGSNTGGDNDWKLIRSYTNATEYNSNITQNFSLPSNDLAYSYYRMAINKTNGSFLGIFRWLLYSDEETGDYMAGGSNVQGKCTVNGLIYEGDIEYLIKKDQSNQPRWVDKTVTNIFRVGVRDNSAGLTTSSDDIDGYVCSTNDSSTGGTINSQCRAKLGVNNQFKFLSDGKTETTTSPPSPSKKTTNYWLIIGLPLILLLVIVTIYFFYTGKKLPILF